MTSAASDPSNPAATFRRGRQVAEIVDLLRRDIISGALPQNSKLHQERLSARFGVSRMPIREAFRLLEADRLVVVKPNKTAQVAALSADDLQEICEMRIAAETLAQRLALPQLTNAQIAQAETIQVELETASVADFGRLNAAFHRTLFRPCARARLLAHIDVLSNAAERYLCATVANLDYAQKSHAEHVQLLQACRERNEAAAVECLTRHIAEAGAALIEHMRRSS